ncbi:MAG: prephenate dehydratase [Nanoarchaeota archaeon]|nr:prephenate dehydratase [Nanoarchaeota archaeon]MBU1004347.1 prephenate dehydratase [Nanoarchaeota archaeon]MBU1946302.1 prephenate dehydratase [Nanoarchaeota archaeon]
MKIATLGPAGTFSHEALLKRDRKVEIIFKNTVWDVFEAVDNDEAEEGIVPIENSVSGSIGLTLDALMEFKLNIIGEIILPVKHNLVGYDGIKDIKVLYVHPVTYEQCEKFIRKNINGVKVIQTSSNAASAEIISKEKDKTKAAIVPREAIEIYKLKVIKNDIQDNKFNVTRFVVLSKSDGKKSSRERTSIAIYPQADKPGLLYSLLGIFAKRNINLTKIESRPSKGKLGDYIFFIDMQGNKEDEKIKEAFKIIEEDFFLKVLGSYPREY